MARQNPTRHELRQVSKLTEGGGRVKAEVLASSGQEESPRSHSNQTGANHATLSADASGPSQTLRISHRYILMATSLELHLRPYPITSFLEDTDVGKGEDALGAYAIFG